MGAHNLSGKSDITLDVMGGLVAMGKPDSVPKGGSPRTHDTDFELSSVHSRAGLENLFTFANAQTAAMPSLASGWANAANLYAAGSYASTAVPSATLNATEFGFQVPNANALTGVEVTFAVYSSAPATVSMSLVVNGETVGTPFVLQTDSAEAVATFSTTGLTPAQVNNTTFGVQATATSEYGLAEVYVRNLSITLNQTASLANFSYLKTFETRQGVIKTLAMDWGGNLWVEDVSNLPGTLTLLSEGITPKSYGVSLTLDDREYLCYSNLRGGTYIPEQYTGQWKDKVTQVGPGAPPTVTVTAVGSNDYPIANITQPSQMVFGFAFGLQSTGPGSTSPGSIVTQYYADSTLRGPDADLVSAFNAGYAVYVYITKTGSSTVSDTFQVTSVGEGVPPGQSRPFYYFTYTVPTSVYIFNTGQGGYGITYQRTSATLTTSEPVPNLVVNSQITIAGTSVAAYNETWPVAQTLDSGNMQITQTTLAGGVATYSYLITTGQPPTVGQLVTITNTLNANGSLNGVDLTIASSTGGASGSFTVGGFSAVTDYGPEAEQGLGVTAGEVFAFDPGVLTVGTTDDPIHAESTGGNIVFSGSGQLLGQGTRQLVEFYIDRNGAQTFPSPPVTFTTPANTSNIVISNASIGPQNIVARGYAITEPGQNGTPGANFFTIPQNIQYTVEGVNYTTSAFRILDNTSTTASFNFLDSQLINATAIDIQGNNLFAQVELGNPGWNVAYKSRIFYGLMLSQVNNFLNLSFDGGYRAGVLKPLGWTSGDSFGFLMKSPVFGFSYYIQNTTGSGAGTLGLISQTAYQDYDNTPILLQNTLYSVRITARAPANLTASGSVVVDLYDTATSVTYGTATVPLSALSTTMQTFTVPLLTTGLPTVPATLQLRFYSTGLAANADVELDSIYPFPTAQPVLSTALLGSYINRFGQYDQDSGILDTASENQQPCNGGVVMNDLLYLLKESSMGYTQESEGDEPDQWGYHEVSNKAGAGGALAYDSGEQWIIMACRNGLYLFTGGEPGRMMLEIGDVWNAINWNAGRSIWVRQDIARQRIYVGVPLPTPNFWLPDAPVNASPQTPNVILMCSYQGIESGEALRGASSVALSGFVGTLEVRDLRRKWSIWQVPALNAASIKRADSLDLLFAICNGSNSGLVYYLNPDSTTDVGVSIPSLYTTYGFSDDASGTLGSHRKNFNYFQGFLGIDGEVQMRLLSNQLTREDDVRSFGPNDGTEDVESDINTSGQRVYLEFSTNDEESSFDLSRVVLTGNKHPWSPLNGV